MISTPLAPFSKRMDERLNRRRQRLLGRGAAALWTALEAIAQRDGRRGDVILPDLICPAVLEAVLAAGFTPRLADVEAATYTITPETVGPLLNDQTQVIVAAHLFGHAAPIEALAALARTHDLRLVEDAVQGIGGQTPDGSPVGTHGDFAFISYDPSKMIQGQGALLLYDDAAWDAPVDAALATITAVGMTVQQRLLNTSWRDLYHGLGQALRLGAITPETAAPTFRAYLPVYAPLLRRRFQDSPDNVAAIRQGWQTLADRVERRREKTAALRESLAGLPLEHPPARAGDAIWRYTVRFPTGELADSFVLRLRRMGGLASHLYYPLNQLYAPQPAYRTNDLARRLVNLWVDDRVGPDYPSLVGEAAAAVFNSVC